jgi:hypothetical protein
VRRSAALPDGEVELCEPLGIAQEFMFAIRSFLIARRRARTASVAERDHARGRDAHAVACDR